MLPDDVREFVESGVRDGSLTVATLYVGLWRLGVRDEGVWAEAVRLHHRLTREPSEGGAR